MNVLRPVFSQSEHEQILAGISEILDSGWMGQGPKVKELEEKWAKLVGAKYAIATNSCTAALDIAVRIVDLPETVTVSPFTFISSALCALNIGKKIKFVDIDPKSYCTPKADIQVMYAGNQFGEGKIYDMAHSSGAKHKGEVSCWSFHAVKNLPTGDGGMITMNDEELYKKARAISWCGIDKSTFERNGNKYNWDYEVTEQGLKAHMNDITAVIALAKLENLENDNNYRKQLAYWYDKYLPKEIERPFHSETNHLYTIQVDNRDGLIDYLAENGIGTGCHYKPLYKYTKVFGESPTLPVTEKVFSRIISLPMHLQVTREDVERICNLIKEYGRNI
jgi:perosamine synthetase